MLVKAIISQKLKCTKIYTSFSKMNGEIGDKICDHLMIFVICLIEQHGTHDILCRATFTGLNVIQYKRLDAVKLTTGNSEQYLNVIFNLCSF